MTKKQKILEALKPKNKAPKIIIQRYCDDEPEPAPPEIAPDENTIVIKRHIISKTLK